MFKDAFYRSKIINKIVYPILDCSQIGLSIMDFNGTILEVNQAFTELLGYSMEEVVGQRLDEIVAEEERAYSRDSHIDFMENQYFEKRETIIRKKDGREIFVMLADMKFNDEQGNIYRITTYTDITEKKYSEIVESILGKVSIMVNSAEPMDVILRNIYNSVRQFIPSIHFFVSLYDSVSDKISHPYLFDEYDYLGKNLNGQKYSDIITEYVLRNGKSVILNGDMLENIIKKNPASHRNKKPMSVLGTLIKVKGRPAGVVGLVDLSNKNAFNDCHLYSIEKIGNVISHIFERKRFEEQLLLSSEKVKASDKIKSAFLTQMSHEIRTPINTMLSFAWLLKEKFGPNADPEVDEYYSMIEIGSKRLMRSIDLILNMSVLQNDSIELKPSRFDLMEKVLSPLAKEAARVTKIKGIEFSLENRSPEAVINGDLNTLTQIFEQLIDNAIKYTNSGSVKITQFTDEVGRICISVRDTGIGISKEYLTTLFTPFSQEEMGYTRKYEGNGLGLALVKKLVKLNNGDIAVESTKGRGSVFTVKFNIPDDNNSRTFWNN